MDSILHTLKEGKVTIIGGRPSVGKTVMALSVARDAAVKFNIPTAYFSLEMPIRVLTEMLMSGDASITNLDNIPLYFNDTPSLKYEEFAELAKELIIRDNVKLFVIDYLQLMYTDGEVYPPGHHYKGVAENLRSLKMFAKEHNVTVIVLSLIGHAFIRKKTSPSISDLEMCCPSASEYADKIILLN